MSKKRKLTDEQKLAAREYQIAYRARNLQVLTQKKKAYYETHKEEHRIRASAYRKRNSEKLRAYDKLRRTLNPEKKKLWDKIWRERTKEARKGKRDAYFSARVDQKKKYDEQYRAIHGSRLKEMQLTYYAANKPAYIARVVKRNAQKLKAHPKWANDFFIEEAYRLAALRTKMLGFKWHVDHIVPLQSKFVCGLHVENNLRVIPGAENLGKGNRHWPGMA